MQQKQPNERIVAEVPRDLKRAASAKAALQGKALRQVLIELLAAWVETPEDEEPEEASAQFALAV